MHKIAPLFFIFLPLPGLPPGCRTPAQRRWRRHLRSHSKKKQSFRMFFWVYKIYFFVSLSDLRRQPPGDLEAQGVDGVVVAGVVEDVGGLLVVVLGWSNTILTVFFGIYIIPGSAPTGTGETFPPPPWFRPRLVSKTKPNKYLQMWKRGYTVVETTFSPSPSLSTSLRLTYPSPPQDCE